MSDKKKNELPSDFDGERLQTDELAPENENSEQVGSYDQAQTVSDQAQGVSTTILNADSEHAPSGLTAPDAQDVVDHMNQMERGNTVDMSASRGEPNHDDNVDKFGKPSKLDGLRGDGT